jgi:MscS family membrane protein
MRILQGMYWWQWLALSLLFVVAWAGGFLLGRLTRAVLRRLAKRTSAQWDDALAERSAGPLTLGWLLAIWYSAIPWLRLEPLLRQGLERVLHPLVVVALFWALLRAVDVVGSALAASPWARERPASRALVPLATRVGKVALLAAAAVALLSELGYPVASLLAGLGIGGLAVALAARSTLENLFGAFSIGTDQPFREGDFVKIEDFVGTVETVGLRSTRIRTLDRTLISLPNGKLADMRIESFTARDRIRLACTVGLVYSTTAAQMRAVLAGLEQVLRAHPKIWPDAVVVRFSALGACSLDIEIMAWFQTQDWGEFQVIRQDILLQFMDVVERAGSSIAFPTRTVHLVGAGG